MPTRSPAATLTRPTSRLPARRTGRRIRPANQRSSSATTATPIATPKCTRNTIVRAMAAKNATKQSTRTVDHVLRRASDTTRPRSTRCCRSAEAASLVAVDLTRSPSIRPVRAAPSAYASSGVPAPAAPEATALTTPSREIRSSPPSRSRTTATSAARPGPPAR